MTAVSMTEAAAALFLVLLSIVVLGHAARRLRLPFVNGGQDGRRGRLAMRSSLALDPKRRLLIFACDGREGLLLLGPQGDVLLGWFDETWRAEP